MGKKTDKSKAGEFWFNIQNFTYNEGANVQAPTEEEAVEKYFFKSGCERFSYLHITLLEGIWAPPEPEDQTYP